MITIEQLLDNLLREKLITGAVADQLRVKVAAEPDRYTPEAIVRRLVDRGQVTPDRALALLTPPDDAETRDDSRFAQYDDLEVLPEEGEEDLAPPPRREEVRKPKRPAEPWASGGRPTAGASNASARGTGDGAWRDQVRPRERVSSPLADLLDSSVVGDEEAADGGPLDDSGSKRKPRGKKRKLAGWDSPLLVVGGGALLLLLIVGGVLMWALNRQTGDEQFTLAENNYRDGQYTNAIHNYDKFLETFPDHLQAGQAQVHRGLAQMRQLVDSGRDWPKALDNSKQILHDISSHKEFADGRSELTALLPKIAVGLSQQANETPSQQLVDQTRDAVALVEKYVPESMRPEHELTDIEATLALVTRRLAETQSLEKAITAIQASLAAGDTESAYATRAELLREYPGLIGDESLGNATADISQTQKSAVRFVEEAIAPATDEPASAFAATHAVAAASGGRAPGVAGRVVPVLVRGVVYAVDAETGAVLWRRFVGFDSATLPISLSDDADSDWLVVNTARQELERRAARDGALRWRTPLGADSDAAPVVVRDQALVALRDGRLLSVALDTGAASGHIALPQPLSVAPAIAPRRAAYYQPADHSNLYVLDPNTGACDQVLYLGHAEGALAASPTVVGRYVFVAENRGAQESVLHVLLADEDGRNLTHVDQIKLDGHVVYPPAVNGRTLLAATDRGAVYSFEIGAPGEGKALNRIAEKPADSASPVAAAPLLRDADLYLAGRGLTKYSVQASRGRMTPQWVNDDQAVVLNPPWAMGDVLVYPAQRIDDAWVTVAAVNANNAEKLWQTRLAAIPLPGSTTSDDGQLQILTVAGDLLAAPTSDLLSSKVFDGVTAQCPYPQASLEGGRLVDLGDGQSVVVDAAGANEGDAPRLLAVAHGGPSPLRWIILPDAPSGAPAGLSGRIVLPAQVGQVMLIDSATGAKAAEPFQPRVSGGDEFAWSAATTTSDGNVLIASPEQLFRLALVEDGVARLAAEAEADLPAALTSSIAVAEGKAFAVGGGRLLEFSLPGLEPAGNTALDSEVVMGPVAVGQHVVVETSGGKLYGANAAGEDRWTLSLEHGPLAGPPIALADGSLLAAAKSGAILVIDAATGAVSKTVETGEPLASGPIIVDGKTLVFGHDGALHVLDIEQ